MKRASRLRKRTEFDRVFREGTVIGGPLLAVRLVPTASTCTRWGFTVGKRVAKKATVRNRVRRRLREAARAIPLAGGYDIVVTARKDAVRSSYHQLSHALATSLRKLGVLPEESRL